MNSVNSDTTHARPDLPASPRLMLSTYLKA